MKNEKFDFSGYATKAGLTCSDGRTILKDAFKHQDGIKVPLVWQHLHNDPDNILGHAILENRVDGVYCYGTFNETESGTKAKALVAHGDISALSIYANQLKEQGKRVMHGSIREVSLVLAGANEGAFIENISFAHSDGTYAEDDSEAIIYTGIKLSHSAEDVANEDPLSSFNDEQKELVHAMIAKATSEKTSDSKTLDNKPEEPKAELEHATETKTDERTVKDVFDTLNDDQKKIVYFLIGNSIKHEDTPDEIKTDKTAPDETKHSNVEGDSNMKNNVFDQSTAPATTSKTLTHDQLSSIVADAKKHGSLKESFIAHAVDYGFNPVDILFPDAKDVNEMAVIKRDTTWVDDVLSSTNHTPFSRIRTRIADLTAEAARAKGYVTGSLKKEEVITLMKRITTPTTIYKKQKLDRDDMVDITDFDVVVWLKREMRGMLNEELARAILISDGRSVADDDKINEGNVRPIAKDDGNVFVQRKTVALAETTDNIIDEIIRIRKFYKGSGVPALYIGTDLLTEMLLLKDQFGHRLYKSTQELASVLRVSKIVEVEPMNDAVRMVGEVAHEILCIVVNLKDYTIGADKGGQVAMFDDFDIDYNQYKYLIETRVSGALTLPKSALIIERLPV